jgi:hypothetical protein
MNLEFRFYVILRMKLRLSYIFCFFVDVFCNPLEYLILACAIMSVCSATRNSFIANRQIAMKLGMKVIPLEFDWPLYFIFSYHQ